MIYEVHVSCKPSENHSPFGIRLQVAVSRSAEETDQAILSEVSKALEKLRNEMPSESDWPTING